MLGRSNEFSIEVSKIFAMQKDMQQQVMTKIEGMEKQGWENWGS